MIADVFFPLPTAATPDVADRHVTRQRTTARIAVSFDLCVSLRRNNRLNSPRVQRFVNFPFVVSAVAIKAVDLAGHFDSKGRPFGRRRRNCFSSGVSASISCVAGFTAKCNFRHVRRFDLPCFRIFHSPSPKTFRPVLSTTHVDRSGVLPNVERDAQFRGPFGQRREIGNVDGDFHQLGERYSKSFGFGDRAVETSHAR